MAGYLSEAMGGLSYLEYVRGLQRRVEGEGEAGWEGVKADLEEIRRLLLQR